ncbi:MAG: glycosyltransferase, partial [Candidatus Omnitrophica bacterium]|nr:glycosyltransferase [Candidatus Omnitrophota bacterium]
MEKVTLYIPCFDAERTIKECLDSVIAQTYPINEIIIIDDGCQDKTMDIVSKYPVRVIKHDRNKGLAVARNTAFKECRNDFVAALDADCAAHSDWLKQIMDCFSQGDIAGAGGILIERHTNSVADKWRALHMSQAWGKEAIENPPFLYGNNTVFRKSIVKSMGMYNEIFRNNYEDVCLSASFYDKGFNLVYNPKGIVEHLRQDTVLSVLRTYRNWQYHRNIKI